MKTVVVTLLVIFGAPASAAADGSSDLAAALARERQGDPRGALAALDLLSSATPEGSFSDDALFHAGRILEDRLARPADALMRYHALEARFPHSRLARRGAARARALEAALPSGEARVVELREILGTPDVDLPGAIQRMESLLDRSPRAGGLEGAAWERATLWLAGAYARRGQPGRALERWEQVVARDPRRPAARQALAAIGALDAAIGRPAAAERAFRRLARLPGGEAEAARGLAELEQVHTRRTVVYGLLVVLLLVVAALATVVVRKGGWSALAPSTEVALFGPVLLFLVGLCAAAWIRADEAAPNAWQLAAGLRAIAVVAAGGLVLSHLGGALARLLVVPGRRRWIRVALPAGIGVLSVLLVGLTLETSGLGPFVLETLRTGSAR
jgi:tetratricopeptide (TPR) repeat protein